MATATDELTLLERVFLRIGSAESDDQLQNAVSKFLPPVLLKLSSQQNGVRKKVMELLIHINKRVKSRPLVQLPVEALLLQYQDPAASSFVINFTIIYIKMGYPRLPMERQTELVPSLLNALEGKPQSHQDSLLLVLMPVLGHVTVPPDPQRTAALFGLRERSHLARLVLDFALDMLLLPYGAPPASPAEPPPGMSDYTYRRVVGEGGPPSAEELERCKAGLVTFLSAGVLPDMDVLPHLVVAAADTRFSVANLADMHLRKISSSLDWSNATMVAPLYTLYLGTQPTKTLRNPAGTPVKPELHRQPASTWIRLKVLPFLCRTRGAAIIFPACIQLLFETLFGINTNLRLKASALQFSLLLISGAPPTRLTPVSAVILSGLMKVAREDDRSLRPAAYAAVGKLASRVHTLVNTDLVVVTTLFESLGQDETPDVKSAIRDALVGMSDAFRDPAAPFDRSLLLALLAGKVESPELGARLAAVRYASSVFPEDYVGARYLLLVAAGDSKEEISLEAVRALYGTQAKSKQGLELPSSADDQRKWPGFPELVRHVSEKAKLRPGSARGGHNSSGQLTFSEVTHAEVLRYLRLCLWRAAGAPAFPSRDPPQIPHDHCPALGRYLRSLPADVLGQYLATLEAPVGTRPGPEGLSGLVEAAGSYPEGVAPRYGDRVSWIKVLMHTVMSGHSFGALQDCLMDWVDEEDRGEGGNEEVDVPPMVDQPSLPPNDGEADTPQAETDLPRDWSLEPDCLDTAEGEDESSWIRCFAVSDGFDLVAAGTACGKVVVWRVDTGKLVHSFHLMRRVVSVCFIGTEYLAVGCTGMSLEVWQRDASGKWTIKKWKTNLKFQPTALSASSSLRLLACFAFLHYRLVVFKSGTGEELYRESGDPQHMLVKIQLVDNVTSIHLVLSVDNTLQVLTWPHRPFGGDVRLTVPTTREFHRGPGFNGFAVHGNYLTYCIQEEHRHPCFTTVDLLSGVEKRIMIPWTRNGKLLSVLGHNLLLGVTGSWNLEHRNIWAADMKSGAKVMDIPCPGVDSRYTEVLGDAWDGRDWCDGHMLLCHIRSKETVLRVVRLRRRQHESGENQSAALDCVPAAIAE